MKRILVAMDFSVRANNALALAGDIASASGGSVILFHVVELPKSFHTSTSDEVNSDQMANVFRLKMIDKARQELENIRKAYERMCLVSIEIRSGDPFKEITAFVEQNHVDLILSGDKGHSELGDIFIGSLSDRLVRSMDIPVVTVKAGLIEKPLSDIMFVVNMELDEEPVMKYLLSFTRYFNATIHLVWINTPYDFKDDYETKPWLKSIVRDYKLENYTINIYNHHDKDYGVVYFADDLRADLIVMAISEKSAVRRLITGDSLAEDVSDHTMRPVMTLKIK